ncbi:TPA: hypothetical protein N6828_003913 [Escherichia coli]|nr:hypothetical protein [Escherichia coli]EHU4170245.1 hypothetical protein [Escherichia coli]EIK8707789.1 hypothetical protein [Escherichia coli]HCN9526530.1 hypothetical protein [Escherichia coli]HCU1328831.1 hypothetical protein [Escherichia coli]
MSFLSDMLALVFTQRVARSIPCFLLPVATQPGLMRHCCYQGDKHIVDGSYYCV